MFLLIDILTFEFFHNIMWILRQFHFFIWNYLADPSAQHHSVLAYFTKTWQGRDLSIKYVFFVKLYKIVELVEW